MEMIPHDDHTVQFLGEAIRGPGASNTRYLGGRLRYYGGVVLGQAGQPSSGVQTPTSAAPSAGPQQQRQQQSRTTVSVNDVVEVRAAKDTAVGLSPFLAQVEAFWEDSFTGIAYCRARWLLRASEVPREDVSEDEVLLTTVTDNIEAAHILRFAPVAVASSPHAEAKREPEAKPEPSAGTRQGLRPKPRSPRLCKVLRGQRAREEEEATATLRLARAYDPFSTEASVLPTDHPVVVQLRARERAGDSGRLKAGGCPSESHGCPRKSGCSRAGAQRKGLDGARLVVTAPPTRAFGGRRSGGVTTSSSGGGGGGFSSSTSSVSVSVGGDSESSNCSSQGGFTSEDSQDDVPDADDDDIVSAGSPRTRRGRRRQATAAAAAAEAAGEALIKAEEPTAATKPGASKEASDTPSLDQTAKRSPRPRRLAMPPADSATGLGGGGGVRVEEAGGRKCQQHLRGGLLIRAAHAGEESEDGLDSPKLEQYPQKETNVGEDHQADIPSMLLTEAERAADKAAMEETAEMGGTAVWSSVRDWTASERERLDGYLEEARRAADEKRISPGVPALISINNGGDRRRKRKVAWAVMAGGKPEDEEKLRVGCAGGGVSEVSRSELQPTQVEELAMQALMREDAGNKKGKGSLIDNARTALGLLDNTMVDDSGPLATWTGPQIEALSKALEAHFDADRFARSRGHERHRDEHTDVTSLIASVDGKTPSQVLSFYYRYMATGDALTEVMGSAEAQAKVRSERRSASLRGPPAPRPSPPPNLRHRPSLRCPTRLQASSFEASGDSDDGDIAVGSYQLRTRRSSRNDRRGAAAAAAAAATGSAGNKGSAGKAVGSSTNSTNSTRARGSNNNDDGGGDGVGRSRSRGSNNNNNNNSSDDSGGGGGGPVTRQPADHRCTSAPEEEEDGIASSRGQVGSRPPAGWAQDGRRGTAAASAEAFSGGEEGRGCKRYFDDHRALPDDARGAAKEQRAPQRPRWQQEVPRQSVPADAVIVEVSDDEEPAAAALKLALAAAAASTTTAAAAAVSAAGTDVSVSNGRGMIEARGPAFVGGTAGDVMAGQRRHGDTGYPHGGASAFARRVDERRKDGCVVADQRQHHHGRRYSDYPYDGYTTTPTTTTTANNNNNNNLHHRRYYHHTTNNNNGFEGNQHHQRNSGYGFGYGYSSSSSNSSNNLGGREPRFQPADRHSRHLAAASSGVRALEMGAPAALGRNVSTSMQGPPQQPGPILDGSWRSGSGGGRGVVSGVGVGGRSGGSTPAFRRRTDELTPMEKCWMLVDFARKDGLPTDRVEYLKGLLRTHEKKSMTFRMLTERTDSCLYDREDIQKGFVEIFGEMELPDPRSSAYRNAAAVALPGADYTTGGGYGVSSRSIRCVGRGGGGGNGNGNGNVDASSYYLQHSGSSRNGGGGGGGGGAAATGYLHHAATAAALPSVGDAAMRVGSQGLGRRVLPPPSALGLMSGMRRLGEGTSMARLSSGGVVPTAAGGAAAAASMAYPTSAPVAAGASL
ncbi:unnamed protein product [Ectocarpus sp. 4 AP-2014]